MVERQLRARGIDDERVLAAMARVPRELFVPGSFGARAYDDAALPIGADQTISQPYMVARICAELQLRGDETRARRRHRLRLSGGGARRARRARCIRSSGFRRSQSVHGRRSTSAGYAERVHVHVADGTLGLPESAPFGGIAVAAAAPRAAAGAPRAARARGAPRDPDRAAAPAVSQGLSCRPPRARRTSRPSRAASSPSSAERLTFAQHPLGETAWRHGSLSRRHPLQLPVRLHGIPLGRPTDLLLDLDLRHVLGFVVRCGDESVRFLPLRRVAARSKRRSQCSRR